MKSIRGKFLLISMVGILLCAVAMGYAGTWSISKIQTTSSEQVIALACSQQGGKMDAELAVVQNSVDIFAEVAVDTLPTLSILRDQETLDDYLAEMESMMTSIAGNTKGVCAYYLRIAPELTERDAGFLFSMNGNGDSFLPKPLTVLSQYDPSDTERVGWYYQPKEAGKPIWTEPYYNRNLQTYMVSYVAPLYVDEQFVGVAGMDVNFSVVLRNVYEIKLYNTGYAALTSSEGVIYYHPTIKTGTNVTDVVPQLRSLVNSFHRTDRSAGKQIFSYQYENEGKKACAYPLRNGMELIMVAKDAEINAPRTSLLKAYAAITVLAVALLLTLIGIATRRLTKPLALLTRAAEQIAEGNMDVELPPAGEDEVGILTRSFSATARSLKKYITGMSDMAYLDPLTRVKNKTAFDEMNRRLEERMNSGYRSFALVMMDLNDLKVINDRYGHDRGNDYLTGSCHMICSVFQHSPVYRIGGDEFVVLLERSDYQARKELLEELDRRMAATADADNPWKRISIAKGVSVCQQNDKSPEDVFRRADQAMYADKRRLKGERVEPRDQVHL